MGGNSGMGRDTHLLHTLEDFPLVLLQMFPFGSNEAKLYRCDRAVRAKTVASALPPRPAENSFP